MQFSQAFNLDRTVASTSRACNVQRHRHLRRCVCAYRSFDEGNPEPESTYCWSPSLRAMGFPVKTKLYSRGVCGTSTDFSFSAYEDHLLLIITQLGTSGTVISTSTDTAFNSSTPTFSTSILMGKRDEPLLTICARRIVEAASHAGCMTPMIICLGLREHSPEVLREVCKAVGEDNVWL